MSENFDYSALASPCRAGFQVLQADKQCLRFSRKEPFIEFIITKTGGKEHQLHSRTRNRKPEFVMQSDLGRLLYLTGFSTVHRVRTSPQPRFD